MASLVAQMVKNLPAMQGIWVQLLDWEDPLEKGMANKSMQSTFPSVQLNEFLPSKLTSPDQEISIIIFQKSTQSESESEDAQSCPTLCEPHGLQPPSTGFSRQEYLSGLPFPSPRSPHRPTQLLPSLLPRDSCILLFKP